MTPSQTGKCTGFTQYFFLYEQIFFEPPGENGLMTPGYAFEANVKFRTVAPPPPVTGITILNVSFLGDHFAHSF